MSIPTAEEAVELWRVQALEAIKNGDGVEDDMLEKAFIKFAKFHVEAALKKASEKAEAKWSKNKDYSRKFNGINKDSILNSYPLENIK